MDLRRTAVGGIGIVCTIATAGVLLSPSLFDPVVAAVGEQDPNQLLLLLGGLVGVYSVWAVRRRRTTAAVDPASTRFAAARERPPETVSASNHTATGARFDATVGAATGGRLSARDRVRETLTTTAVQTYLRVAECDPKTAQDAISTGTWTDDRVAAAFLGGEEGPQFPLWARLRGWLDPSAEHDRRIRRTTTALRTLRTRDGVPR